MNWHLVHVDDVQVGDTVWMPDDPGFWNEWPGPGVVDEVVAKGVASNRDQLLHLRDHGPRQSWRPDGLVAVFRR